MTMLSMASLDAHVIPQLTRIVRAVPIAEVLLSDRADYAAQVRAYTLPGVAQPSLESLTTLTGRIVYACQLLDRVQHIGVALRTPERVPECTLFSSLLVDAFFDEVCERAFSDDTQCDSEQRAKARTENAYRITLPWRRNLQKQCLLHKLTRRERAEVLEPFDDVQNYCPGQSKNKLHALWTMYVYGLQACDLLIDPFHIAGVPPQVAYHCRAYTEALAALKVVPEGDVALYASAQDSYKEFVNELSIAPTWAIRDSLLRMIDVRYSLDEARQIVAAAEAAESK